MKIVMGIFLLLFLGGCGSEKSEAEADEEAEAQTLKQKRNYQEAK